jgi:FHS family L-fucose permease-like MFS transporter
MASIDKVDSTPITTSRYESYTKPLILVGIFFCVLGFITWLNAILIPYLTVVCELKTDFQSNLVAFATYISYFIMSLPSYMILKKTGFKNGMSLSLIIIAIGALLFIPAALTRNFNIFLVGLFVQGMGMTILQSAVNPYVTILGPIESAAKRISIMGICNKLAGVVGPLILASAVLGGIDELKNSLSSMNVTEQAAQLNILAARVINPYIIISVVAVGLAIFIRFSSLPDIETPEEDKVAKAIGDRKSILSYPHLLLGVVALFFYVGVEVTAGDLIIKYGNSLGIHMDNAKFFTSITLICMTVGYMLGIALIPKVIKQETALRISALIGVFLTIAIVFTDGYTSVICVSLLGFANAIVWPAMWPLALNGLGSFTKTGSALLVMAIAGGAIIPLIYGYFASPDLLGRQQAYWILMPCYLFIFYYAFAGHKVGLDKK